MTLIRQPCSSCLRIAGLGRLGFVLTTDTDRLSRDAGQLSRFCKSSDSMGCMWSSRGCPAFVVMVDVMRRWIGEQERHVRFYFGSSPEQHVRQEVACEPSVVGSLWRPPACVCGPAHRHRSAMENAKCPMPPFGKDNAEFCFPNFGRSAKRPSLTGAILVTLKLPAPARVGVA